MAIPLTFTLLFSGALLYYGIKELGNLSIQPAIQQDMSGVELTLETQLPSEGDTVSLYSSTQIHNIEYGRDVAEFLKESLAFEEVQGNRINGANRKWMFKDHEDSEYYYNYNLNSGEWGLYNDEFIEEVLTDEELLSQRDHFEKWLLSYNLLPENFKFSTQQDNILRWDDFSNTEIVQGTR